MSVLRAIGKFVWEGPGELFGGINKLIFGYTKTEKKHKDNETIIHETTERGLLDLILVIPRAFSNLVNNHKAAVNIAFWLSLATAGAVALTLFLWPATLTAVVGFSIYGLSIAAIAGANTLLQIGLAAGLAFAATSLVTYFSAAIVNAGIAIKDYCFPASDDETDENQQQNVITPTHNISPALGTMKSVPQTPSTKNSMHEEEHHHLLNHNSLSRTSSSNSLLEEEDNHISSVASATNK